MAILALKKDLLTEYSTHYPSEVAQSLNEFSIKDVVSYLKSQPVHQSSLILKYLNTDIACQALTDMDQEFTRDILSNIDPSIGAALLSRMDEDLLKNKLKMLPPSLKKEYQEILSYPNDTAGSLMDTRVIEVLQNDSIQSVLNQIRNRKNLRITDLCVVDPEKKLIGIIPVQDIATSDPNLKITDLKLKKPISIHSMSHREDIVKILEETKLASLPVVDHDQKLLGIIRYDKLVSAAQQVMSEDIQAMFGVSRDEQALSKVGFAIKKRLPWLEINLLTAFLAATVVGLFEETIAKYTALAIFLPVVAGQSGNTGSQALAVTMRGLALKEIRPRHWFKMASKEIAICFVNGVAVSLTTSLAVYIWMKSIGLSLVIGIAMVISMVIAGLSGAIIPMVLQKLGQDPASSSSIVLTTVTDVVGFFTFLGLATMMASLL